MIKTKYGIVKVEKSDMMADWPDMSNQNMDAVIKQLDDIQEKIGVMQRDIEYLRTLYYGGDRQ